MKSIDKSSLNIELKEDGKITQVFREISPADFFYRNREIAGFTNPTRAIFSAVREMVENSLDAAEVVGVPPDIYIRISHDNPDENLHAYTIRVEDNGSGIPPHHVPLAFGQFLFSSKYVLKQARGTFGLGGTMAILYGQITTNKAVRIVSSTGKSRICEYLLMIDIERNRPIILNRKLYPNRAGWHGTIVEFHLEGDYYKAMPRILEYLKQTAIVNPYANITFVDPRGRLYLFLRKSTEMPPPPKETLPHPHGVDVEMMQRIIRATKCKTMLDFMRVHFHRVRERRGIARKFLKFAGVDPKRNPKTLKPDEIVELVQAMKEFDEFLPPDASCLSPLGESLLRTGILKELEPEFVAVRQRKPSAYSGHPFIVEVGIAYGGKVPVKGDITLYRFANKIPLIYDESGDVSWKIIKSINWRRYGVNPGMPIAVFVHLCSTKVPYKTVGKEFIADIPEVSREIANGIRDVARQLKRYLSRREYVEKQRRRLSIFSRYLPKIARFSAELASSERMPDVNKLYKRQMVFSDYVTTNEYVDSEVFDAKPYRTILVYVKNKHSENSVNVRVLGFTGKKWRELIPEVILSAGSELYEMLKEGVSLVKVQAKSASMNKEGVIEASIEGLR